MGGVSGSVDAGVVVSGVWMQVVVFVCCLGWCVVGPTPWDFEAEDPGMVTHFQLPRNAAQVYRQ